MRDAGREKANRRHLLRNLELFFELNPARHILDDDDRADGGDAALVGGAQRYHGGVHNQR